ncbi:MAG: protease inhibitor I42 family protein [Candidatus Hermodarchaeota archaeon]
MVNEIKPNLIEAFHMKEFSIILDSNPSTGYSWVPSFDKNFLELINRAIKVNNIKLGSTSKEIFKFYPIKCGITTLTMIYKRVWEKHEIQKINFKINIQ